MTTLETRLQSGLERLVGQGVLTREQADAVLREASVEPATPTAGAATAGAPAAGAPATGVPAAGGAAAERRPGWTAVLAEVGGYVGAAFVAAAVAVFTGPHWNQMSTAARIAVLGVPAVLMVAAGIMIAASTPGGWPVHERPGIGARRRLIAALWLSAGGLLAGVTGVLAADPSASGAGPGALIVATALVVWLAGYLACRTPLLHVAAGAAAAFLPFMVWEWLAAHDEAALAGASLLVLAVLWAGLSLRGILDEKELGLGVAGAQAFIGAEALVQSSADGARLAGYLALGGVAVIGLLGYVATRLTVVLIVGVVALATVVPQAVIDYTDGALGAAGALLVTGLSIVGASVLGLRLHRDAADHPASP
jgi:hypothetical protein